MGILLFLIIALLFFAIAECFGRAKHIGRWWTFLLLTCTPILPGIIALILSPSANKQPNQPNKTLKIIGIVFLVLAIICLPPFLLNLQYFGSYDYAERMRARFTLLPLLWFSALGIYLYKLGQGKVVNKQAKFYFKFQLEPKLGSSIVKAFNQLKPNPYSSPSNNAFYFLVEDGKQSEPYTFDLLRDKRIKEDDLVWRNGLDNWVKAGELKELSSIIFKLPPPIPTAIAPIQEEPSTTEPIQVPVTNVSNENQDYTPPKPPDDQWSNSPFILLKTIALVSVPIILVFVFVIVRNINFNTSYEEATIEPDTSFETPPIDGSNSELAQASFTYTENTNTEVCRAFYGGDPPELEYGNVDELGNLHIALGQNIFCTTFTASVSSIDKPILTDVYTYSGFEGESSIQASDNEVLLVFWGQFDNQSSTTIQSFKPGKLFVTHDGKTVSYNECLSLSNNPSTYFENMSLSPGISNIVFAWRLPKYDSMHIEWQPSLCENENVSPKIHIW